MKSKIGMMFIFYSLAMSGCSTTPSQDKQNNIPSEFDISKAQVIETRENFISNVVGRKLNLLSEDIDAELTFFEDLSANGQLQSNSSSDTQEMNLVWEWEEGAYCRTGTVGETVLDRKCEKVTLYPGVGIQLTYIDSSDPEEFWVFE